MTIYLDDLAIGQDIACGSFTLTPSDIIDFASRFDPQPWHLDDALARETYFQGLCASGLHSQGAAINLMVRAIPGIAIVAGGGLHAAKFFVPVRPDTPYDVTVRWTDARVSERNPTRGVANISGEATGPDGRAVMQFGVTFILACRPA